MNNLRWRIALIVVIIGACLWAIIPPEKKIRLGLDLKGGVHLVLRVDTDEALKLETMNSSERFREALESAGVTGVTVTVLSPTQFQVTGLQPAQDAVFRQAAVDLQAMFDRQPGAGGYTFVMKPNVARDMKIATVVQAQDDDRATGQRAGRGRADDRAAGDRAGPPAGPAARGHRRRSGQVGHPVHGAAPAEAGGEGPGAVAREPAAGLRRQGASRDRSAPRRSGSRSGLVRRRRRRSTTSSARCRSSRGATCASAKQGPDQYNQPAVHFEVKGDAATRFGKATRENINRLLAIVLDGTIVSAPNIEGAISDQGPDLRDVHDAGGRGPGAEAPVRRPAGSADLHAGADDRPDARPGLDQLGRAGVADQSRPGRRCSCSSSTGCRASTRLSRSSAT